MCSMAGVAGSVNKVVGSIWRGSSTETGFKRKLQGVAISSPGRTIERKTSGGYLLGRGRKTL